MYIVLMFQICHFHYWLSECVKSDSCRSTAGCPYMQFSSYFEDGIPFLFSVSVIQEMRNCKQKFCREKCFFTKLCIFLGKKILSVEIFQLQTAQDIPMNVSFMTAWEAFFTSNFLWVVSSCQSQSWWGETLRICCKAQTSWLGRWWGLGAWPYYQSLFL